jgi:hypothetical protein
MSETYLTNIAFEDFGRSLYFSDWLSLYREGTFVSFCLENNSRVGFDPRNLNTDCV